jgi:hypothetical protein
MDKLDTFEDAILRWGPRILTAITVEAIIGVHLWIAYAVWQAVR